MTLTERDKKIAVAVLPLFLIVVYWFMLLAPKRKEASAASETLATEQARLNEAESNASTLGSAKSNFARDYAAVVRLGKAVPSSVDMPSLLVQLEQAAKGTGIDFESVTTGDRVALADSGSSAKATGSATPAAPAPGAPAAPAPNAPSGQPAQSGPGQAAGTAQGATDAANASAQNASSAAPGSAATPPAGGAATADPAAGTGLETVPLDFSFTGSFFELADFFHKLKRFVYVSGDQVRVRGRLMTIDSVQYTTDPSQFPRLTAKAKATVFLSPKAEGVTAGATPGGPAAPQPGAPPTSTASTGGSAPAPPTAAATP